jgi:hypothetical protein
VGTLPPTLTPDTLYLVRVGDGVEAYCTDATGSIAYPVGGGGSAPAQSTDAIGLVQAATGGGSGYYVRINEAYEAMSISSTWFDAHATYAGIREEIIDGQYMVRIPKFWFQAGVVPSGQFAGKAYWMISPVARPGFSVHPAFVGAGGTEMDQIWVGKFKAGFDGTKLVSVPAVMPAVSMDFPTARQRAYARNAGGVTGFRLLSVYDLSAIQMLASIEAGGTDMQAIIGNGWVSGSAAVGVSSAYEMQASWRGLWGLWGNVWQMVDGLKRNGGAWWRWQYNAPGNTTTSDFATGYVNTGRAALTSSGFPVTFDTTLLSSGIIVPATVNATVSNGSTGDYFHSNTSTDDQVAYHGGGQGDGATAGLFSLNVSGAPASTYSVVGCRLARSV